MKNKIFIISSSFDYSKLICFDAGPYYAKRMGWNIDTLDNIQNYPEYINIIDNKMTDIDCFKLEEYISKKINTLFLLLVIDPYYQHKNKCYYRFLEKMKNKNNVFFFIKIYPFRISERFG